MAKYRISLADRNGISYGPIILSGDSSPLQYSNVINGGGGGTLTARFDQALFAGQNRDKLTPWASEIVIERLDGYGDIGVISCNPVQEVVGDLDGESLSVTFVPLWAWMQTERLIQSRLTYPAYEQTEIAGDLIVKHTTDLGRVGDIRLGFTHVQTGVKVSQQYLPSDQKSPGAAIADLCSATKGFDFDIVFGRDANGRIVRTFVPFYPQKGRKIEQVLTAGRGGLRKFNLTESSDIATRVTGTGSILNVKKQAAPSIEDRFGVHQRSISLTDSNSRDLLNRQVADYLAARKPPVQIISFSYNVSKTTPFRFIDIGDMVRIKVGRGWIDFDGWVRVIGYSVTVDSNGNETVDCQAAGLDDL